MTIPWTAIFWLGFLIAYVTLATMMFGGIIQAGIGLFGVTLMFVGSKIGREFLSIT